MRMKCTLAEARNERKSCLDAFALIQVKSLLLSFFTWGVSACMSFTSDFALRAEFYFCVRGLRFITISSS